MVDLVKIQEITIVLYGAFLSNLFNKLSFFANQRDVTLIASKIWFSKYLFDRPNHQKNHKLSKFGLKVLNFGYFHNITNQIFKNLHSSFKLTLYSIFVVNYAQFRLYFKCIWAYISKVIILVSIISFEIIAFLTRSIITHFIEYYCRNISQPLYLVHNCEL